MRKKDATVGTDTEKTMLLVLNKKEKNLKNTEILNLHEIEYSTPSKSLQKFKSTKNLKFIFNRNNF